MKMQREICRKKLNKTIFDIKGNPKESDYLKILDRSTSDVWREMLYFFARDYSSTEQEQ
jgi:hypothetical protein